MARRPTTKVTKKTATGSAADAEAKLGGVTSEAVKKATGKGWDEWLRILDKAGAKAMPHKAIAELLHEKHDVPAWWSQMVTVGYEQARGLREKHEMSAGFQVSASKTINVGIGKLFKACDDAKRRSAWLDAALSVRKSTKDKSIRITWEEGPEKGTNVEFYFIDKGEAKSQIAVNHGKLKSSAAGAKMKKYWGERLVALKTLLEA